MTGGQLRTGGIARAQGPEKEKPRAEQPDGKATAPTIRIHRAKATADGYTPFDRGFIVRRLEVGLSVGLPGALR